MQTRAVVAWERCLRVLSGWRALAALAAALFTGLFFRALFLGEVFVNRDLRRFYWPARSLILPLTRASEGLPLWNPLFNSGQPFAANPHFELFHPLTLLFFALPFDWAFRLQVLLPPLLGGASMAFLLRTLGRSRGAAAFGALAWAAGGGVMSATTCLPALYGYAPVPAFAAFLLRAVATRSTGGVGGRSARGAPGYLRSVAAAGLMLGLVGLSGELSALVAAGLVAAAVWLEARPRTTPVAAASRVTAALLLGAAISAAALLPGYALSQRSARADGVPLAIAQEWSSPLVRPAELVFPRLLGHVETRDERLYWGSGLFSHRYPFVLSVYAGLAALLLAVVAARYRPRAALAWGGVALAGYVLAAGEHLPAFGLARQVVPFLSSIRFPERFLLLLTLALPVLAAIGWDEALSRDGRPRRLLARLALGTLAISLVGAGLAAIFAARGGSPVFWMTIEQEVPAPVLARTVTADFLRQAAAAALLLLLASPAVSRRAFALGLVAHAAVDLGQAHRGMLQTDPVARVASPPSFLAPLLQPPLQGALFHAVDWDTLRPKPAPSAAPPIPAQWGLAMVLEKDYDMSALATTHEAIERYWQAARADPSLGYPLLLRRGVAGVVRFKPQGAPGFPLEALRLRETRPFAFFARRLEAVADAPAWVAAVRRLGREVLDTALVSTPAQLPPEPSPGTVELRERRADRVRLDVTSQGPGPSFLALNQTWDRGWSAELDGRPVPLLRTDISLSGLVVPPGRHTLLLRYRDRSVTAGLAVSFLGLAFALAMAIGGSAGAAPPDPARALGLQPSRRSTST